MGPRSLFWHSLWLSQFPGCRAGVVLATIDDGHKAFSCMGFTGESEGPGGCSSVMEQRALCRCLSGDSWKVPSLFESADNGNEVHGIQSRVRQEIWHLVILDPSLGDLACRELLVSEF